VPHLFTHSFAHSVRKFGSCSWEKKEERGAFLSGGYSLVFGLCLGIVLAIYIKEVFAGFSPP
jgi:hypothetical protein